jgi:hypothetical protein
MKKILLLFLLGTVPFIGQAQEFDFDVCVGSQEDSLCAHQYVFAFDSDSSGMYYNDLIIYARVRMLDSTSAVYEPDGWVRNFSVLVTDKDGNIGGGGPFSFGGTDNTNYPLWRSVSYQTDPWFANILTADTFFVELNVIFDDFGGSDFMISDPQVYKIPNPLLVTGISDQETITFDVFPNPASTGYVTVSASTSIATVDLYDLTGRAVKMLPTNTQVSVTDLPAGMYIIRADEASIPIKRLVIQ